MGLKSLTKIYVFETQRPVFAMFSGIFCFEFEFEKQDFSHVIVEDSGR